MSERWRLVCITSTDEVRTVCTCISAVRPDHAQAIQTPMQWIHTRSMHQSINQLVGVVCKVTAHMATSNVLDGGHPTTQISTFIGIAHLILHLVSKQQHGDIMMCRLESSSNTETNLKTCLLGV